MNMRLMFPLSLKQFQCCHRQHLLHVNNPGTRCVEGAGGILYAGKPNALQIQQFATLVCQWAGGAVVPFVLPRVLTTSGALLRKHFQSAILALQNGNRLTALASLQHISGLGGYSVPSKCVRMLAPHLCGVLDRLVERHLREDPNLAGLDCATLWDQYSQFCVAKADELTKGRVALGDFILSETPCSCSGDAVLHSEACSQWSAGDVDMACFAWLRGWCCEGTGKSRGSIDDETNVPPATEAAVAPLPADLNPIYLCQNHQNDQAVTLKEHCDAHQNLAWICRLHGQLDFKLPTAQGVERYLAGEISARGGSVFDHPSFRASLQGRTCHNGGASYLGGIRFGDTAGAVRYLKQYFKVIACVGNLTETQEWIDQL